MGECRDVIRIPRENALGQACNRNKDESATQTIGHGNGMKALHHGIKKASTTCEGQARKLQTATGPVRPIQVDAGRRGEEEACV